ncbi:MAG: hypothetical protein J0I33_00170 [Microbacterium ginsengisoli]|uniref:hypothetical protein n=1 Tax=Microbacterium TaxID=33882 RepID=UPI000701ABA0|nr:MULTISPECIES: hypothetical protein [unclassified Microbacterium]KQR91279.1 hypothetical protein ASF93_08000 [Microbacterium sp. Leaf347]KQS01268.1 hypothetical protein ASG00_10825 [Microbacterium sp. Leaf351]MBN9197048.1 hypothetical protein [Microbacterium ginsengisoli]OJU77005.1 MAG: hypothetical protein BGO15_05735 [Microbacterium sp. 71-23]
MSDVLVPSIDPATGKLDPAVIPGGATSAGAEIQCSSWFFPGPVSVRSGVAAISVPTFGPLVELLGLSLTTTLLGVVTEALPNNTVDVRVNVNDVPVGTAGLPATAFQWHMRKDDPAPAARIFTATPRLVPQSRITVDVTRVLASATAQPENLTVQLWWRWRDAV